ncbi:MAG: 1-(5-phosphoribosyl)-5-[Bacteroidales bacterium]|nr:1-(5-phosphoribosyl)-5-[(5-phosphoribosylamino)methylideneamino]imidazole-4-carboxamide isomerase [Bacteroidales bacterium]
MQIIPAIDVIDGKCVRLSKGEYDTKKVYNEDPLEVARQFQDWGVGRLHVVDLDGAKAGHIVNHKTLDNICGHTSLTVDFGGGLKTTDDLRVAFDCGAAMVTGGSIAVKNPAEFEAWIAQYGPERIILGADAKDRKIAVTGWTETSAQDLIPFVSAYRAKGINKVICTDISRDGMLQGPAVELYKEMMAKVEGLFVIASGGVSCAADIEALADAGIPAVIVGKAIYEKRISPQEIMRLNDSH